MKKAFDEIKTRLTKIQEECASIGSLKAQINGLQCFVLDNTSKPADIVHRLDDSEDWSRPSHLVFFDAKDADRETWAESNKLIIENLRL